MLMILPSACKKGLGTGDSGLSLYVSGGITPANSANTIAAFWKNGSQISMPIPGVNAIYAVGEAIAVSGNNIYVAGYEESANGYETAMIWKNGQGTALSGGAGISVANAVAVDGNNVYAAGVVLVLDANGNGTYQAVYWQNGVQTVLPAQGSYGSSATALVIQNGQVYAAGWNNTQNSQVAAYWANGIESLLTDSNATYSTATGIAVSGTNVYVCGWEEKSSASTATYWLNGAPVSLTDSSTNSSATGITLSGNDVYVAGTGEIVNKNGIISFVAESYLMYWKDDTLQNPADSANKSPTMSAGAISVAENNVYVAGSFNGVAVYWKNGVMVPLTAEKSLGTGIAALVH
jgi:hypothetical protein